MLPITASYMIRTVVIDDDDDYRDSLVKYLRRKGYDVTAIGSAVEFYEIITRNVYDVAIIDIGLPDQDGLLISSYLRAHTTTRIVIVSGRASVEDRLRGYESGAGVYLVKPVDFREIASVAAALMQSDFSRKKIADGQKMKNQTEKWILKVDEWMLITPEERTLRLTAKEYMLLERLAKEPERGIVSREALLRLLDYQKNKYGNHSLESLVYRLRKKISPSLETPIKTANTIGYSFIAKIEVFS